MKAFFEFLPIIVFFGAYKFKGIFFATAAAVITGIVQVLVIYIRKKKIEPMVALSVVLLAIFGGLTLIFHNESFIKWKPTILYWLFSSALIIGRYFFNNNLIKAVLAKQLTLPEHIWDRMNISWSSFFGFVGLLNLVIAARFSTDIWVNFKMFGLLGCMLIFIVGQGFFLMPYMEKVPADKDS